MSFLPKWRVTSFRGDGLQIVFTCCRPTFSFFDVHCKRVLLVFLVHLASHRFRIVMASINQQYEVTLAEHYATIHFGVYWTMKDVYSQSPSIGENWFGSGRCDCWLRWRNITIQLCIIRLVRCHVSAQLTALRLWFCRGALHLSLAFDAAIWLDHRWLEVARSPSLKHFLCMKDRHWLLFIDMCVYRRYCSCSCITISKQMVASL